MGRMDPIPQLVIEEMLKKYPPILQFFREHLGSMNECEIQETKDKRFPFITELTKTWTPGMVYEDHRYGTRNGKLFILGPGGAVHFGETVSAMRIGSFLKALETTIRDRTFRAAGLATHTVWHTEKNEPYSGSTETLSRKNKAESVGIGIFELPEHSKQKTPDGILKDMRINLMLLKHFSFAEALKEEMNPLVVKICDELLSFEKKEGVIPPEGRTIGDVLFAPVPLHRNLKLFRLEITDYPAEAIVMIGNDESHSVQSFTASHRGLLRLLHTASEAVTEYNIRNSFRML